MTISSAQSASWIHTSHRVHLFHVFVVVNISIDVCTCRFLVRVLLVGYFYTSKFRLWRIITTRFPIINTLQCCLR